MKMRASVGLAVPDALKISTRQGRLILSVFALLAHIDQRAGVGVISQFDFLMVGGDDFHLINPAAAFLLQFRFDDHAGHSVARGVNHRID